MINRINRKGLFGWIVIGAIVLLTIVAAPSSNRQASGSTFSRAPDGYGAWYAYMERQGVPIQRWQKPWTGQLTRQSPATFLQIVPDQSSAGSIAPGSEQERWVRNGNTLIILGAPAPVTDRPFTTMQPSDRGLVKIETTRRRQLGEKQNQLLGDQAGAIVWQTAVGKGRIIFASTPYLAANAYQNEPGNFAFLAQLVQQNGSSIWVDEYIHGYKEAAIAAREGKGSWTAYLTQTPLLPILVQSVVVLLVLIWATNRRFGQPMPLMSFKLDNSEAYIQALAGVLHKAGRSEFVLDGVGKHEQLQIQKALGLGSTMVELDEIVTAWVQQTGRPAVELEQVLKARSRPQRISEPDLLTWIKNIQLVRQRLP
ncbi:MAG: DUF4350 domain-containing protein [Phormidesmis sp. CAN_BIN36]|nr:DUF4350 domain-containing protein [Phormidesmis sp. CAN_BIN36]